jgi:glycosyltransferase involved in cell wall biosynthesis
MDTAKKKIKLVIGITDFRVGGAQKVVTDVISNMDTTAFEINLITLFQTPNQDSFYETIPPSIAVHKLNFKSFYDLRSWTALYQLLKKIKPDIVWSHLYFSNTVFRILRPLLGYIVITVEHNTYVNKTSAQKFVDWWLAFFTYKIVAVSDYVANFTSIQEHISREKFVTVPNGVDVSSYSTRAQTVDVEYMKNSLGFASTDKVIISVGQLIRQKNHTLLIDAFAEFVKTWKDYKLIILGEGAMRSELEEKIIKYAISDSVKLLGIQKDTPSFYAISDFFVLPSLFEGFALVCIEAMDCGLPVVTTRVAGPDRYISEGQNGFFFEPSIVELVKKLQLMADMDVATKEEMARNAKAKASEYDISTTVTKYENLFKEATRTN